jgi:alanyl-tRNA synthetase
MRVSLEERGLTAFDEETFNERFDSALRELQQVGAQQKAEGKAKVKPAYLELSSRTDTRSEFKGYETTSVEDSKITALIKGADEVQSLREGDAGEVVLNHTPFYAESGGQVRRRACAGRGRGYIFARAGFDRTQGQS